MDQYSLPTNGTVLSCCSNLHRDRIATSSVSSSNAHAIQVWQSASSGWELQSEVQVPSPATHLSWAHPEAGLLVAAGSATGCVYIVEAPRPTVQISSISQSQQQAENDDDDEQGQGKEWKIMATLQGARSPVRQVCWAPRQYGLVVCAAYEDGTVQLWEADRPLAPNNWCLQAKLKVSSSCSGVSWRPFTAGLAPLLAISCTAGVKVWQYMPQFMRWQKVKTLSPTSSGVSHNCTALAWCPPMGHPCDMIAAACGRHAVIWSLQGDTSALKIKEVACLEHAAAVWKVEFNKLGTCLAVGTEDQRVQVYRQSLVNDWMLLHTIQGSPDVGADGGEMDLVQ